MICLTRMLLVRIRLTRTILARIRLNSPYDPLNPHMAPIELIFKTRMIHARFDAVTRTCLPVSGVYDSHHVHMFASL